MYKRLILIAALGFAGCGQSQQEPATREPATRYARTSPEYELAAIDNYGAHPSDADIKRYASVLKQLRARCTDSRGQLADWASAIKQSFTSDSEMHLLKLALEQVERADALIGPSAKRGSCKEIFVVIGVAAKGGA